MGIVGVESTTEQTIPKSVLFEMQYVSGNSVWCVEKEENGGNQVIESQTKPGEGGA